jgi:hypothetical protein
MENATEGCDIYRRFRDWVQLQTNSVALGPQVNYTD